MGRRSFLFGGCDGTDGPDACVHRSISFWHSYRRSLGVGVLMGFTLAVLLVAVVLVVAMAAHVFGHPGPARDDETPDARQLPVGGEWI